MCNHSSRASDGSRPVDDTGQKPEVPAGVGPMINMQRGEARDSFLAGIVAHDGDGDLSSGFKREHRDIPPVLKGEEEKFQKFKHEYARHLWPLRRSGDTSSTSRRFTQTEGSVVTGAFSSEEIRGAYQAWNFTDGAFQRETDR